jgi:arylsulfatase A-like enzyme
MFGNENYFFETGSGGACATQSACIFVGPGFAWNHGDYQKDITRTWVAMVGPGVQQLGRNDEVFTDHADVRPTIMALLGLKDDYVHEGRVVAEWMNSHALPQGIRESRENFTELAEVYKQLNAPLGQLGRASLVWSNRSITSTDKTYTRYLKQIGDITAERDDLADKIKTVLNNAEFHGQPVGEGNEDSLGRRAKALIDQVSDLADHGDHADR